MLPTGNTSCQVALSPAIAPVTPAAGAVPPRERILAAASALFYAHGIRAVGVEAIAEAADTNKMTLYRHFESKDVLVAEYLRRAALTAEALWTTLEAHHPGDPVAQLRAWFTSITSHVATAEHRGCALTNAAIELPDLEHPARAVIRAHKTFTRERIAALARAGALDEPNILADELFLLLEGARVTAQSVGREGLSERLQRMGDAILAAHRR